MTFLTIHVVGSNNNLGISPEGDAEWAERTAANVTWLREGFASARASDSRGVVNAQQANPRLERPPADRVAFNDVLDVLREETVAFGRPVLFVHGDSHYFRVDKPMTQEGFQTFPIGGALASSGTSRASRRSGCRTTTGCG